MKNNFLDYVHNFRGFAILLIVGVHCRTSLDWPKDSYTHDILFYGLDFSTILFVFISGFLFQYVHAKQLDYRKYISKKLKFVILPYIIISIPAILDKLFIETNAYWMSDYYKSLNVVWQIVYMLISGKHSGPFYFIPMIGIVFLLAPVFYYIQNLKYFNLIMATVVTLGMFSFNYGYYATMGESLVYFIPVYLFGIWAGKNHDWLVRINTPILTLMIVIYLLIFSLEMTHIINVNRLTYFEATQYLSPAFNWAKLKMMCLAIILINVFYRLRNYNLPTLQTLGNYSFGVYFVHLYFINLIVYAKTFLKVSIEQNLFIFLSYLTVIIGLSMFSVYIIKLLFKKRSRLIIGS